VEVILNSLFVSSPLFIRLKSGGGRYNGVRPGPEWHAHGWFSKSIVVLVSGVVTTIELLKRRWRLKGSNTTCHSRPPDDPTRVKFCTLIIVLRLWAWMISVGGFFHRVEVLPGLGQAGSDRTVQRWIARALANSQGVQQAIRQMLLTIKNEPRPEDDVFRRGRSPPEGLVRRCSRSIDSVSTLWRAFDMLFVSAKDLSTDVSFLLAEARGRWFTKSDIFPV
jgi:hypothetical protein